VSSLSATAMPASEPMPMQQAGASAQLAAIGVSCAAAAGFLGLPVIVGQLAELRGLTPEQLGRVASAEALGVAVTSLAGAWAMRHLSARHLMVGGMLGLALLQAASALAWSFPVFLLLRLASSVAAGIAVPALVGILGRAPDPERAFSRLISVQVLLCAVELAGFGPLAGVFGLWGIYGSMALLALFAILMVARADLPGPSQEAGGPARRLPFAVLAMVAAVLLFFSAIGAYWAFIERAGVQAGMSAEEVGVWLAASNAPALLGSVSAPWCTRRFGERRVLLVGLALAVLVPLGLLWSEGGRVGYLLDLAVFVVLWNLVMVVQMAVLGRWDASGRAVALTPAAQSFGLALAPVVAGSLAEQHGFAVAVASASAFALVALVATVLSVRRRD
jgi:predicted MFS family arabinose efflux permease